MRWLLKMILKIRTRTGFGVHYCGSLAYTLSRKTAANLERPACVLSYLHHLYTLERIYHVCVTWFLQFFVNWVFKDVLFDRFSDWKKCYMFSYIYYAIQYLTLHEKQVWSSLLFVSSSRNPTNYLAPKGPKPTTPDFKTEITKNKRNDTSISVACREPLFLILHLRAINWNGIRVGGLFSSFYLVCEA